MQKTSSCIIVEFLLAENYGETISRFGGISSGEGRIWKFHGACTLPKIAKFFPLLPYK